MKSLISSLLISLLFASCSNDDLTKKEVLKLLQKDYPKTIFYSIYTADLDHAKELVKQGIVKEGLVRIDSTAAFPNPCIFFTDKANNLLAPTPKEEQERLIQRVKTAESNIAEITGIRMLKEGKAVVEYTTEYVNLTPFAVLGRKPIKSGDKKNKQAFFSKYTDGWRIDNRNEMDFLME